MNITSSGLFKSKQGNLYQVNFLRTIASVSVCLFHLTCGNTSFLTNTNIVRKVCSYGYLGVEIFFIVSGFVICYSLPANYQLKDCTTFFKKRLTRVEPPYLASIFLTLIVGYFGSLVSHHPIQFSWINLLYHIGYINNFTSDNYINGVYWTLGIEFQFYVIIGLLFPVINKSVYFLIFTIISLIILSFLKIDKADLIFRYTPLFCIGILTYFIRYNNQYNKVILFCLMMITLSVLASGNPEVLLVSLCTISILCIQFNKNKTINFLSKISYSLYLIHVPIGGRIINLSLKFVETESQKYFVIALALIVSIIVASIFYLVIEKPAVKWSKQFRYEPIS